MSTTFSGNPDRSYPLLSMSGLRSSHWPWKAFAPPMPTGPTMSGPLPDWISVASWPFDWTYVTTSNVSLMFGWLSLKALTTASSTLFCSGASPPPRQQYQRISTGPPGGTVAGPVLAGALALAPAGAVLAVVPLGDDVAVEPPQAPARIAIAATTAPGRANRDRRDSMCSSSTELPARLLHSGARGCRPSGHGGDGWARCPDVGRPAVLPAGAGDDALDVVTSAIAADVAPGVFDRPTALVERGAFDEESGRPRRPAEESRLASAQEDGLERLASANHAGSVAQRQQ